MFGMQILDVAIGMVFIFLMLSLVVTAFNELMAAWLKRRSKTLWRGVVRLLGDEGFARTVYGHPLISSLSQSSSGKPSYIPSRTFALAVLDGLTDPGKAPPANADEVRVALSKLPEAQQGLTTTLSVLLHDSKGDMEEFKKTLGQWFDNSMLRVSGWYKRQTQWILLAIAAGVTIWTNADAIALTNALWRDPAVRQALVAQAQQYVDQQRRGTEGPVTSRPSEGPPKPPAEAPAEAPEFEAAGAKFDQAMNDIHGLAIPLGWGDPTKADDKREPVPSFAQLGDTIATHGLGWLLTALAITMGAPFWFDMLNKVISIRSSGKAPEGKREPGKKALAAKEPREGALTET